MNERMDENALVIRPFKIIGEVFTGIAGVFLIVAAVGQEWVEVHFYRTNHVMTWGLWDTCVGGLCLPEDLWMEFCQAFCLLAVLLTLGAFICGIIGLCVHSNCSKRMWFVFAGALLTIVALFDLLTLIIYPIMFSEDIQHLKKSHHWHYSVKQWNFDWTYGFGWGGFIFTVAAAIFFILPFDDKRKISKPF